MSRSRCWATSTATSSIWASANAIQRRNQKVIEEAPSPLSSTRRRGARWASRRSRWRRPSDTTAPAQWSSWRAGPLLLFSRDEHPSAGGAPGDRDDHRHRSRGGDDPRRRGREASADPGGCEARRLGGGEPHLCGRPDPQLPALHRPARDLSRPQGGDAGRRHGAQRHRRRGGRRDLDLLRSDNRQAGDPCAHPRGGDRRPGDRTRRIRDRRHPAQHSVPVGAHAASALAFGPAFDGLHRRGVPGRLQGACAARRDRPPHGGRGSGRRPSHERTQARDLSCDRAPCVSTGSES